MGGEEVGWFAVGLEVVSGAEVEVWDVVVLGVGVVWCSVVGLEVMVSWAEVEF